MSTYPNEYSTGTNIGGRPWTNRRFWSRTESKAIRSNTPTSFKPWLFWRVDHDSKGPYLSLRYYREASNESEEIIRKSIYDKLSDIIYSTIGNEKDKLKCLYKIVFLKFIMVNTKKIGLFILLFYPYWILGI